MKAINIWVSDETAAVVEKNIASAPAVHAVLGQRLEIAKQDLAAHLVVCTEAECILADRLRMHVDSLTAACEQCGVMSKLMVQISEELAACPVPFHHFSMN